MENSIIKNQNDFSPEIISLIKKQVAPQASDSELQLFIYQCKRTGLDPLVRQIYCIHRGGKMTIQTSIDGFRVIAERSGTYAGQDEPIWEEGKDKPVKCTVKVYRFAPDGQRYCAGVGVAYWVEYAQQGPMWNKMAHTMLAKCAEALALRKAFPQDLSGLYTNEEMNQADPPQELDGGETYTHYEDGVVTDQEKEWLTELLETSTYEERVRQGLRTSIGLLKTRDDFDKAKSKLLLNQIQLQDRLNLSSKERNKVVNDKANADA